MENYQVRFGGGRMEKGAAGFPSLPLHYGLMNPGISRELASRLPNLLAAKLLVDGNEHVDLSEAKISVLGGQIETQLRPVLRERDYEAFDLPRVIAILEDVVRYYQAS